MINQKQAGLTLIEMMIAMILGLFVTAVIITVFSTNVRSSTENIKMIRLNQELRGVMTMMVDELKRSGYSDLSTISAFNDDFNVSYLVGTEKDRNHCIRYSYDADSDADDGDLLPESNERFGFKLEDDAVKWTTSGGNIGSKGSPECGNGTWEYLTDTKIAFITTLNFDISNSANTNNVSSLTALTTTEGVSVYDITITLTGTTDLPHTSVANDPRRTLTETIRIRNEDAK